MASFSFCASPKVAFTVSNVVYLHVNENTGHGFIVFNKTNNRVSGMLAFIVQNIANERDPLYSCRWDIKIIAIAAEFMSP